MWKLISSIEGNNSMQKDYKVNSLLELFYRIIAAKALIKYLKDS